MAYLTSYGGIKLFTQGVPRGGIDFNGNVGIGTLTPDAKFAVNGTIHTKEVKMDLIGFPDYVFRKSYRLLPLTSVKAYIDANQHLPEVPSASEVEKNGMNVGEMNKLLMKKVEELTLYIIEIDRKEQDKEKLLHSLQQQVEALKSTKNKSLKSKKR